MVAAHSADRPLAIAMTISMELAVRRDAVDFEPALNAEPVFVSVPALNFGAETALNFGTEPALDAVPAFDRDAALPLLQPPILAIQCAL